jgi:hypothetical protein
MATIVCLNKHATHGPIEGTERQYKEEEMKGADGEGAKQNNHLSHTHSLPLCVHMYVCVCVCVCVCVYIYISK